MSLKRSLLSDRVKQYKDSPFTIVRPESIVTVLPKKYVHELRNVPDSKLYAFQALADVSTQPNLCNDMSRRV